MRLFGQPRAVHGARVGIASATDGLGSAVAVYDGFVADVAWSKITDTSLPSEIQGEDASLLVDAIDAPRRLVLTPRGGVPRVITVPADDNPMIGEVRRFAEAVAGADIAADQAYTATTLRLVDELLAQPLV